MAVPRYLKASCWPFVIALRRYLQCAACLRGQAEGAYVDDRT
jgi:hypothetical protein